MIITSRGGIKQHSTGSPPSTLSVRNRNPATGTAPRFRSPAHGPVDDTCDFMVRSKGLGNGRTQIDWEYDAWIQECSASFLEGARRSLTEGREASSQLASSFCAHFLSERCITET